MRHSLCYGIQMGRHGIPVVCSRALGIPDINIPSLAPGACLLVYAFVPATEKGKGEDRFHFRKTSILLQILVALAVQCAAQTIFVPDQSPATGRGIFALRDRSQE